MPQLFINNWAATLTAGITDVTTTINVGATAAADLTAATTTNYYMLTIDDDTNILNHGQKHRALRRRL